MRQQKVSFNEVVAKIKELPLPEQVAKLEEYAAELFHKWLGLRQLRQARRIADFELGESIMEFIKDTSSDDRNIVRVCMDGEEQLVLLPTEAGFLYYCLKSEDCREDKQLTIYV